MIVSSAIKAPAFTDAVAPARRRQPNRSLFAVLIVLFQSFGGLHASFFNESVLTFTRNE